MLNSNLTEKVLVRENIVHIDEDTANEYFDVIFKVFKDRENIQQLNLKANIKSYIPIILSRLTTITSQDRNIALAKEFLNLTPSLQSNNFKIIIDNLDTKNVGYLVLSLINYALANPKNYYNLPERYTTVQIDQYTLVNIEESITSADKDKQHLAFNCISYLLKYTNCDTDTCKLLTKLVKNYRKKHSDDHTSLLSYDLVNCDEQEKVELLKLLAINVNNFCSTNYIYNSSSKELSNWRNDFQDVCILWRWLSIEQANKVVKHNII